MEPTIVAIGGGGCGIEPENRALDDYLLGLTGKAQPRVLFIPTASGDNDAYIARFYHAFAGERCHPMHLPLFQRTTRDLRSLLLQQDMIYVGGGNTAAMLAIWRQHGLFEVMREAWEAGILLCGVSAGGNCWFEACSTDSFGLDLDPLPDGRQPRRASFHRHAVHGSGDDEAGGPRVSGEPGRLRRLPGDGAADAFADDVSRGAAPSLRGSKRGAPVKENAP
jgi:dipeptidase E